MIVQPKLLADGEPAWRAQLFEATELYIVTKSES
jgi:hypothetical protein